MEVLGAFATLKFTSIKIPPCLYYIRSEKLSQYNVITNQKKNFFHGEKSFLRKQVKTISDNWVVKNLENAIGTWNEKLAELWQLITQTPETFKGGQIWAVIVNINSALVGIGYGLLVLFFAMGVFQSAASFRELQRPEFALRHFIRFAAAKVAVGYGLEIMTAIFAICGSVVAAAMGGIGGAVTETATLPAEIVAAIEDVGIMQSVPLWLVSVLGSLFITVMSFILNAALNTINKS